MNKKRKKRTKKKIKRSLRKTFRNFKKSFRKSITKVKESILINKRLKDKYKIIDVPLEKKENKGTEETSGFIDYHYQKLDNISEFLAKISENNDCYVDDNLTIEYDIETKNIKSLYSTLEYFKNKIYQNKNKRFIAITFNVQLITFSHANIILIDNKNKNIEFFEPHGHKEEESTLEGIKGAYLQKSKSIKKFIDKILPDYKFINVSEIFKQEGFQMKYDARHGYCVTWSILYSHYRLLNPDIKLDVIIQYIYYYITTNKLLRYAKFIEKILKKI